jgi:tRNA(Ile)-lysidine synthetase-like protein
MLGLAVIARRSRRSGAGVQPVVVHVHHHVRGRSADLDAQAVKRESTALGLPYMRRDVHPAREPGSRAAAARRLRYAALVEAAAEAEASTIVVAHHAEDQLESMLMALARGTGLEGLSGMPWRRSARPLRVGTASGGHEDGPPWLARPLLACSKAECEAFCRLAGRSWRRDPGNRDRRSPRVRLRMEVLPVLEALWPGAARRAGSAADLLRDAHALLAPRLPEPELIEESRIRFRRSDLQDSSPFATGLALRLAAAKLVAREQSTCLHGSDEFGAEPLAERGGFPVEGGPGYEEILTAIRLLHQQRAGRGGSLDWAAGLRLHLTRQYATLERRDGGGRSSTARRER